MRQGKMHIVQRRMKNGKTRSVYSNTTKKGFRIVWNWWRTNRVRVKYFPKLHRCRRSMSLIGHSSEYTARIISNSAQVMTQRSFSEDPGHLSTFLGNEEMVWDVRSRSRIKIGAVNIQSDDYQCQESGPPIFRGTCALCRGVLKWVSNKQYLRHGEPREHRELMERAIHSANQFNIHGAVSSWCTDLCKRVQCPTFAGVNISCSWENDQFSKQLDLQEFVSFGTKPTKDRWSRGKVLAISFATIRNVKCWWIISHRSRILKTISRGMHYWSGEDVNDG